MILNKRVLCVPLLLQILPTESVTSTNYSDYSAVSPTVDPRHTEFEYYFESNFYPKAITIKTKSSTPVYKIANQPISQKEQSKPIGLSEFINSYHDCFVTLIDLTNDLSILDIIEQNLAQIGIPINLLDDVVTERYGHRSNFTARKFSLKPVYIILLPKDKAKPNRIRNYPPAKQPPRLPDYSFREIFYLIIVNKDEKNLEEFFKLGEHNIRYWVEFKCPTNIFVGIVKTRAELTHSDGNDKTVVTALWYLCKYCQLIEISLTQMQSFTPDGLRTGAFEVNQGGLNYIWEMENTYFLYDANISPYLGDVQLRNVVKYSNDMTLGRILLNLLFTGKGSNTRWLNLSQPLSSYILSETFAKMGNRINSLYEINYEFNRVTVDMDSYNFITCNGVSEGLDIEAYLNPFDNWVWVSIFISLLIGPLFCAIVLKTVAPSANKFLRPYWFIMEGMALALINQYFPRENLSPKESKYFKFLFRSSWGIFLLMSIVLVNGYIGLGITNLIAPRPMSVKWETVEQISNSTLLASVNENSHMKPYLEYLQIQRNNTLLESGEPGTAEYTPLGADLSMSLEYCDRRQESGEWKLDPNSSTFGFCEKIRTIRDQLVPVAADLKQIGQWLSTDRCSKRIFYFTFQTEIEDKLIQLQNLQPEVPFYTGKSKFHSHTQGWKIAKIGSGVINRLEGILSSGIYKLFKELTYFKKTLKEGKLKVKYFQKVKGKGLRLDSNGVIIFHFYLICLLISALGFVFEVLFFVLHVKIEKWNRNGKICCLPLKKKRFRNLKN